MNKVFWNFLLIFGSGLLVGALQVQSQTPYCLSSPVGFGAQTTGGGKPTAANTVTVNTASELSDALSGSKSVILVSGTISTSSRIKSVITSKTILGLPGAKLTNLTQTKDSSGVLEIKKGSSNVIIRNLTFIGPGAYDCDGYDLLTNAGCTGLWVDHCEFQDGMDGNFDNTKTCDNISVSWCKFTYLKAPKAGGSGGSDDHRFSNLVGGSDTDVPEDGKYSITWLCCWWADGCVDRMVRARNAEIDMLNCYWNSKNASKNIHLSPGTNGTYVYVENGVFACSGDIVNFEKSGNNNVKFVNCTGGASNSGTVSAPAYSWSPIAVGSIAGTVANASCGAGATLMVSTDGAVSSSCEVTGMINNLKYTEKSDRFNLENCSGISIPASFTENMRTDIYTMSGQKALSFTGKSDIREKIRNMKSGIYMIRAVDVNGKYTGNFIKK